MISHVVTHAGELHFLAAQKAGDLMLAVQFFNGQVLREVLYEEIISCTNYKFTLMPYFNT